MPQGCKGALEALCPVGRLQLNLIIAGFQNGTKGILQKKAGEFSWIVADAGIVYAVGMDATLLAALDAEPFYRWLYQMAREEALHHVLEIGSATGQGSTRILIKALRQQHQPVTLHCLEADPERFAQLQHHCSEDWVRVYPYLSVYPLQYPTAEDLKAFQQAYATRWRQLPLNQTLEWLAGEQALYAAYASRPEPVSGVAHLKAQLGIDAFDMVVLDGGEFSGPADLDAVYGANILVLDDINTYKNHRNYLRLKADPTYYLIQEDWQTRHGAAVFKRRPAQLKPGITAIVHTRNAAEMLPECLSSLHWVDELLLIDMYSEDQTCAIAAAHGARIYRHVPVSCVDEARNFGLAQARHAWTLVLDADERLPADWVPVLQAACQAAEVSAYWLPRSNHFFGQHLPFLYPDYQLRLFQSQSVSWSGRVHEHPTLLRGQARYLESPDPALAIQHQAYSTVGQYVERQLRYAEIRWAQNKMLHEPESHALRLRQAYDSEMQRLLHLQIQRPLSQLEWLVRHLDRFTDLSDLAIWLERTGQLKGGRPPRLSAYSYLYQGVAFDYPFIESLQSVLPVVDELVVTYAEPCPDGTYEQLLRLAAHYPQLRLLPSRLWTAPDKPLDGSLIRQAAEEAMAACTGDWLWHLQADEVYSNADAKKVRELVNVSHHQDVHGFIFNVLHFYGDANTVVGPQGAAAGWYLQCVRLSRKGAGQHEGDAWTQSLIPAVAHGLRRTDITLYHYGHLRQAAVAEDKNRFMYSLYRADGQRPAHFVRPEQTQHCLVPFDGQHPESMAPRLARQRLQSQLAARPKKPRILVLCRSPQVKKGYGITLHEIYQTGILQQYYELHHLAWHYHGAEHQWQGVHFYPDDPHKDQHPWRLRDLLYRLQPDNILLHADAHFFLPYRKELMAWQGPVTGWFTVDYERTQNPLPLRPLLQRCNHLLGLADFGLSQLQKDARESSGKVPLGVNLQQFYPVTPEQKQAVRQALGWPQDAFVFLCVANHFWRKGLEYTLAAFAALQRQSPEIFARSQLYLHTESNPDLLEYLQAEGLAEQVMITPQYDPFKQPWPTERLVQLYQGADAFVLTSLGEGFGMPLLEAQAVGLPIVVSDNSVTREVAHDAALYIRCPLLVAGKNAARTVWLRAPDPEHAAEQMALLVRSPDLQVSLRQAGLIRARTQTWEQTATLLAAELAKPLGRGKLEYHPPEPGLIKV